ncbi:MAG: hypothetical protein JO264_12920 [Acidisphaera sp.]|nr:hypothetical protein [Acidisphaera sp.]
MSSHLSLAPVLSSPASSAPASSAAVSSGPVLGGIDGLLQNRYVAGWAWRPGSTRACHVRVISAGEIVAEALADLYRADLLRAGKGLGHCGFQARLRVDLPAGDNVLALVEAATGSAVGPEVAVAYTLPLESVPLTPLAALIRRGTWSDEDVLANLAGFHLEQHCREMGLPHFVDVVFRYILGRWAEEASLASYVRALRSGDLTPDSFFAEVLVSAERKRMTAPLPSPFDAHFPFRSADRV